MSSGKSLFLCNTDVIISHINHGLSSSTTYLFFLHLTQQPLPFTFKTPSIEEKLALENLCVKARQGEALWREVCRITETIG